MLARCTGTGRLALAAKREVPLIFIRSLTGAAHGPWAGGFRSGSPLGPFVRCPLFLLPRLWLIVAMQFLWVCRAPSLHLFADLFLSSVSVVPTRAPLPNHPFNSTFLDAEEGFNVVLRQGCAPLVWVCSRCCLVKLPRPKTITAEASAQEELSASVPENNTSDPR